MSLPDSRLLLPSGANIARYLPHMARLYPERVAVLSDAEQRQMSYAELDRESDRLAWGLRAYGITRETRVLLMVPAGLPLISLTFALMKAGCVPILIDPAMGWRNLGQCITECVPQAMIGVPHAHVLRLAFPDAFRTIERFVVSSPPAYPGAVKLADLRAEIEAPFDLAPVAPDDPAAIIFTTGSTGVPKGVLYAHGMFEAQVRLLRDAFAIEPGEVEMTALPVFSLFDIALGVTSAIPPIDPTRPAACDPAEVVAFIERHQVTTTFGSPAIWDRVTRYCIEHRLRLPTLRRVLMAGAPVPLQLHERFEQILGPEANTYTPYGATEALPVTAISGREVLAAHAERRHDPTAGTCVGRPLSEITLRIIPITDEPIPDWRDDLPLPPYQVGEICVKGPMVTRTYVERPQSTAQAKIADGDGFWHRMGDLGYLDDAGRVWFYGRKTHRVETSNGPLFTEPVELIFNQHPHVFRSALVGIGERATTPDRHC
jgi:acyl-CoA synthetase (AMP-forming)/AMP-acid ligase II